MEMSFAGIIGLVLGIAFSYYDKKSGSKLYKKWYNISNKNNIDPNLEIGFVSNQLFGQKLSVALILTAFAYVISFVVFGVNAIHALFYMIPFIIGLMIAFYTSSLILGIFSKKANKVIDYIEEVEKGGIDLKEEAKKGFDKAKEKVMETVTQKKEEPKPLEKEIPKEEPVPKEKKDDNWRDGVKKFMDK
ncbi:MAG: hypothetical protein ACPGVD_02155 [Flavobacteriales bacterium]